MAFLVKYFEHKSIPNHLNKLSLFLQISDVPRITILKEKAKKSKLHTYK